MCCGALTGSGAVLRTAGVRAGERTAVIGVGGVGLAAVQACRLAGASCIVAVDTSAAKLKVAERFGATATVLAGPDTTVHREVLEATTGGADFAFDCVGTPGTLETAFKSTRTGGTTALVGAFPAGARVSLVGADFISAARPFEGRASATAGRSWTSRCMPSSPCRGHSSSTSW